LKISFGLFTTKFACFFVSERASSTLGSGGLSQSHNLTSILGI
jgi:hypothetical protein